MKRAKPHAKASDRITKHLPADSLMAQAWVDCLRYTISEPEALAAFHTDTGSTCTPGCTPIDRMIDEATGREREFVEQYLAWFNENVWGEE
jgi:hypothetical protein